MDGASEPLTGKFSLNRIAFRRKLETQQGYGKQQHLRWRANRRGGPASGQGTFNYAAGVVGRQPGGGWIDVARRGPAGAVGRRRVQYRDTRKRTDARKLPLDFHDQPAGNKVVESQLSSNLR